MNTDHTSLLLLLNWMSPAFPIGGFAYSHGLEFAIAQQEVCTWEDVEHWIDDVISSGSGWNDAVLFAQCWHHDEKTLNDLALALAGAKERFIETTQLGHNFSIAAAIWTNIEAPQFELAYPIAAAQACKVMAISQHDALLAFLQGFCAAMVSVAVRLVPLGQTSGLRILRNLMPIIVDVSARAVGATLDDIGTNTIAADIAAMKHETLEPRIFRT